MELSAVGDRVFAAEAILKRRVRKVSYSPACFDFKQMLAAVSTAALRVHRLRAVFVSLCNAMGALWLLNASTLLARS